MSCSIKFVRFAIFPLFIALSLVFVTPAFAAQTGGMLYLVEFEASDAGVPSNREQAIEMLEQLIVPSLQNLAKDGRISAGGLLVGARAGVMIVEAKSHDEVTQFARALPAWGIWNWKVTPLESFAHRADLEKKIIEDLRAQK